MMHSFDIEHAQLYGMPEAVLITNFQHWITKNRANGTHFHDGRTWTYNSVKAFSELFPYLSIKQIRRALAHLIEKSVLIAGNYNKTPTNHTLWYAFVDEARFLGGKTELPKRANRIAPEGESCFAQEGKSTNRTDINTGSKHTDSGAAASKYSALSYLQEIGVDPQIASDWLQVRKGKKAAATKTAIDGVLREIERAGMTPDAGLRICCERGWAGFKGEWVTPTRQQQPQAAANSQLGPAGQATAAASANLIARIQRGEL
jgi:hypothetical protein